jgi:hypothetical protein
MPEGGLSSPPFGAGHSWHEVGQPGEAFSPFRSRPAIADEGFFGFVYSGIEQRSLGPHMEKSGGKPACMQD